MKLDNLQAFRFRDSEVEARVAVQNDTMMFPDPNMRLRDIHAAVVFDAVNIGQEPRSIISRTLSCLACSINEILIGEEMQDMRTSYLRFIREEMERLYSNDE